MFTVTAISGALSGITFPTVPGALWVGPGLLFAVTTSWLFVRLKWLDNVQSLLWIFASTGAWYLAVRRYAMHAGDIGPHPSSDLIYMIESGLVGSLVLATVFSLLRRKINISNIAATTGAGIAAAAVMNGILTFGTDNGSSSLHGYVKFILAFVVWQVAVGLTLLRYKPATQTKKK